MASEVYAAGTPGAGALKGEAGDGTKRIQWDGKAWKVDDLRIRVKQRVKGVDAFVAFELKDLRISDENKWLVAGRPRREETGYVVPMSIREGAIIAPPSAPGPVFGLHPSDLLPRPAEARESISVKIEVCASVIPAASLAAGASAGKGAVRGSASKSSQPLGFTSEITYQVVPPQPVWKVTQKQPLLLRPVTRTVDAGLVQVCCANLPAGWLAGATANVAVRKTVKDMGVSVHRVKPVRQEEGPAAEIETRCSETCLRPVAQIDFEDTDPDHEVALHIITKSPYLGTRVQEIAVKAQALDVAVYFRQEPAASYRWDSDNSVRVRLSDGPLPAKGRLKMTLRHTKGWPTPPVEWTLEKPFAVIPAVDLDDEIATPRAQGAEYRAPTRARWMRAGSPTPRPVYAKVGDTRRPDEIAGSGGLYFGLVLEANIELLPLRKARLRFRVAPLELASGIEWSDPRVRDAFVREFLVDFDGIE